ncbi:hypothetical protein LOTGIDRAFT_162578 [Lottia gigantea]|uniref:pyridoxal 5'-phosphate synthase n=1 Tax=Lottia gigantea TaxID=225164 RepID=V4A7C8_LOTGI|nr:hypothetical protein LOTGIDRAFT_162578 [Lottia gigantea]ESO92657.1 hypothetical protein LOTGIDRAFT_162578 [Lottia gigantea]
MADEIAGIRHPYLSKSDIFDIKDLHSKNPFQQFNKWFEDASQSSNILEPNAMALATASNSGVPSVRMLLLKGFSEENGFVFYTNYESRKSKDLQANPQCSLMFYWEPLRRSVRIEGKAAKMSREASEKYFSSRPRDSQISAIVSKQGQVVNNREFLDKKHSSTVEQYGDKMPIEMPDYWGGFHIQPSVFEFWQGQSNRLHDRIMFRKLGSGEKKSGSAMVGENGWIIERLSP